MFTCFNCWCVSMPRQCHIFYFKDFVKLMLMCFNCWCVSIPHQCYLSLCKAFLVWTLMSSAIIYYIDIDIDIVYQTNSQLLQFFLQTHFQLIPQVLHHFPTYYTNYFSKLLHYQIWFESIVPHHPPEKGKCVAWSTSVDDYGL